jgi:hypothetical protein
MIDPFPVEEEAGKAITRKNSDIRRGITGISPLYQKTTYIRSRASQTVTGLA